MPRKKSVKPIRRFSLKNIILIALAAVLVVGVLVTAQTIYSIRESTRPASLSMTRIVDANCLTCTTVGSLSDPIKNNTNVNLGDVKTLEFSSIDAKALIMKYNITKIPALIVTGEFKKDNVVSIWGQLGARMLTDAVIVETNPPYIDTQTSQEVGLVSVSYIVDPSCSVCANMTNVVTLFEQQGMKVAGTKTVDYNSTEGKQDIQNYNIQHVPAIIFSNDINAYPQIHQLLSQVNSTERNGSFAFHTTIPPYLDLAQNKIFGLVNVIVLNDSSCKTCYDPNAHFSILQRFGVAVVGNVTYDVNSTEGQALITKYNITKVPTILLSPDASYYQSLVTAWNPVGTIEKDGWFVFRSAEVMGTYRNITAK